MDIIIGSFFNDPENSIFFFVMRIKKMNIKVINFDIRSPITKNGPSTAVDISIENIIDNKNVVIISASRLRAYAKKERRIELYHLKVYSREIIKVIEIKSMVLIILSFTKNKTREKNIIIGITKAR